MVSDWGGCNDRVKGLLAGNQLEMPTTAGDTNRDIIKAIKDGAKMFPYGVCVSSAEKFPIEYTDDNPT